MKSNNEWYFCPECGSTESNIVWSENHKQCENCGQEYFTDIDYTDVCRQNLSKFYNEKNNEIK